MKQNIKKSDRDVNRKKCSDNPRMTAEVRRIYCKKRYLIHKSSLLVDFSSLASF